MGIPKAGAALLYELKKDYQLGDSVLQLGKQALYVEADQLPGIAAQFGFDVTMDNATKDQSGEYVPETYNDIVFFEALGFKTVSSLDYSDYEGADLIHDLNTPIPQSLHGKYDFVYDGGTLEHVFDFPQCLRNIHNLLKVGGLVAHAAPSHNHVDHGFYMYSPTVFWDYYHANHYKIIKSYIYEYETEHTAYTATPWLIYDYHPSAIQHLVGGGWGRKRLGIWFVAQKLSESRCDVVPQQGAYTNTWNNISTYDPYLAAQNKSPTLSRVKMLLRSVPLIGRVLVSLSRALRNFQSTHLPQSRPPVIARY
jgi:SAM-dependent methyltransferase